MSKWLETLDHVCSSLKNHGYTQHTCEESGLESLTWQLRIECQSLPNILLVQFPGKEIIGRLELDMEGHDRP